MKLNRGRIWLGGLAGGVVWNLWSFFIYHYITSARYVVRQNAGLVPENAALSVLHGGSGSCSCLFWRSRSRTCTPGRVRDWGQAPAPRSRSAFWWASSPASRTISRRPTWSAVGRALPFGWMIEMWLGAILTALVAGYFYKE